MFVDHDKSAYLDDLLSVVARDWLHPGSVVYSRITSACRFAEVPGVHHARAAGHALGDARTQDASGVPDSAPRPGADRRGLGLALGIPPWQAAATACRPHRISDGRQLHLIDRNRQRPIGRPAHAVFRCRQRTPGLAYQRFQPAPVTGRTDDGVRL